VTTGSTDDRPGRVPAKASRAGEVRARWAWAEPSVWTDRMLTALETGSVQGGTWYSLIDKVSASANLQSAFAQVKANQGAPGVDHVTIAAFERRLDANRERLRQSLKDGTYRPQAIRRVWIPKPGRREQRPLGIPTVRDRVAQTALRNVIEPIFERDFAEPSYGFRPGRSAKDALRRVTGLLKAGYAWVVDADVRSYFDTIPHERLMSLVRAKVSDGRVLALLEAYLRQEVMEAAGAWTPAGGTPQGAVISPLLANIYLDPLDHVMAGQGFEMVRYADDFVILCRSKAEAREALSLVSQWMTEVGLSLHPEKTRIVDARERGGFDFLGYHFERGHRWPSAKSVAKVRARIRPLTRRANGHSLDAIIVRVNRTLRGWYEYFQHSGLPALVALDGWVRMRLRSILRHRRHRRGRGRGADHQRWPNAFFAAHGLFSLAAARATARQSARR
jgi:RNA-directed DNA polymerase